MALRPVRSANPGASSIRAFVLSRGPYSEEEDQHLRGLGADIVIRGEREIGIGMLAWLRGERSEPAPADSVEPEAPEPKLPPVENLLAKAVATPAAALVVTEPAPVAVVDAPLVAEPEVPEAAAVVDAVPVADVIILPPPEKQQESETAEIPAASLESVATTPAVGEAPAQIDEIVVPPVSDQPEAVEPEIDSVALADVAVDEPVTAETEEPEAEAVEGQVEAEPEPEDNVAEADDLADLETLDSEVTEAEVDEGEADDTDAGEPDEADKPGTVPPVTPEPKG
jgi:CPA2 family monovalent cation:H+ antiporter-2